MTDDWPAVAAKYQGIIIAPYIRLFLASATFWFFMTQVLSYL